MQRIRKGDEVIVITGRDKGKKGTVTAVHDDGKVVVEGINIVKKHVKPNPMLGQAGGIMDKTLPIEGSNVMLVNAKGGQLTWPTTPKPARVTASATKLLTARKFASSRVTVPLSALRHKRSQINVSFFE